MTIDWIDWARLQEVAVWLTLLNTWWIMRELRELRKAIYVLAVKGKP
jgi:hypothetical protein